MRIVPPPVGSRVGVIDSETLLGVFVGLGLSAAAGLRLFVPLLVMSAAALSGHLELSSSFDWIGTREALIGFAVAAALEIAAYLIPFLDNALDVIAAPAAGVAGTVLMASSIVEMSPLLKWTLAIVAGGGVAGTVQLFTSATRLVSTATTAGLANPAVSVAETGSSAGFPSSRSRRRSSRSSWWSCSSTSRCARSFACPGAQSVVERGARARGPAAVRSGRRPRASRRQ